MQLALFRVATFQRGACGVLGWTMVKRSRKVARSSCTLSNERYNAAARGEENREENQYSDSPLQRKAFLV